MKDLDKNQARRRDTSARRTFENQKTPRGSGQGKYIFLEFFSKASPPHPTPTGATASLPDCHSIQPRSGIQAAPPSSAPLSKRVRGYGRQACADAARRLAWCSTSASETEATVSVHAFRREIGRKDRASAAPFAGKWPRPSA